MERDDKREHISLLTALLFHCAERVPRAMLLIKGVAEAYTISWVLFDHTSVIASVFQSRNTKHLQKVFKVVADSNNLHSIEGSGIKLCVISEVTM